MQLGCTKKLLDFNDHNRFGFVLYGLRAKEFKEIDKLIIEGIQTCLKSLKINDSLIEQYIKQVEPIQFSKTKGPKYVAMLNKACERVGFFYQPMNSDKLYQSEATKYMNADLIKINYTDYEHPYQLIIEDFENEYNQKATQCEAMELLIKLDLGKTAATRRLIIPSDINFKQLHDIIQIAFGWKNYHLHEFMLYNVEDECDVNIISEIEMQTELNTNYETLIDTQVKISDHIKLGQRIIYRYDFGDNWEHAIKIIAVNCNYNKNFPLCSLAEGDAPPEDVGGIPGYEEFCEIISNTKHPEYEQTKSWVANQFYKGFDLDLVNRQLKHVLWK